MRVIPKATPQTVWEDPDPEFASGIPETIPQTIYGELVPIDPSDILLGDIRLHSDNAELGKKHVLPYGPQAAAYSNGLVDRRPNGITMTPEIRAWLEVGAQRQSGPHRRTEYRSEQTNWDQGYILNPTTDPEVV